MRRLPLVMLTLVLAGGTAVPRVEATGRTTPRTPSKTALLAAANGTGFAHPALGAQDGRAQFLVLLFTATIPASNDTTTVNDPTVAAPTDPATTVNEAGSATVTDAPATTVSKTTVRNNLWELRDQLDRVASGSRGGGRNNGTAATLSRLETRLLGLERERAGELISVLESGDPSSAAYGNAIRELTALRERVRRLTGSSTTTVADGARSLITEIEDRLEGAAEERATELRTVLEDTSATTAARDAAAAELIFLRDLLRTLPRSLGGGIDVALDTYFKSRVDALTAVLDDDSATATAREEALAELRRLRNLLLEYAGDGSVTGIEPRPVDTLLGEIEKRLVAEIGTRVAELLRVLNDASTSAGDRGEAVTELLELLRELQGLTAGQTAARNEGDSGHDDLIRDLTDRIVRAIGSRYTELATGLGEDAGGAELGAAIDELLEAWRRLRELGQTDTQLYEDLEASLRSIIRAQVEKLTDTVNDEEATDAERAAAAAALTELYEELSELDATLPRRGDTPAYDPSRYEIERNLDEYVRERIGQLEGVLDGGTSTARDKEAALQELRQLRDLLIRLGRRPANATGGGRGGDASIGDIDRRLLDAANAKLDELAGIIESDTATAAQKKAALLELEQLRDEFRGLPPGTGETENRIDRLLQQGLDEQFRGLERDLEGAEEGGPPPAAAVGGSAGGAGAATVALASNPDALASSIGDLQGFGMPGGPTLAAIARSTGTSTGPGSFDITVLNAGGEATIDGNGVVVEPLSPEAVERVQQMWPQLLARANAVVSISPEGYCLEKEQRPPTPGELFALASAGKQQQFADAGRLLDAGARLHAAGQLQPEAGSDPEAYFHAIRQWSIWTQERGYDQAGFTTAFVEHTRENLETAGFEWTGEIEEQVRGWAGSRFQDITNVRTAAGLAAP